MKRSIILLTTALVLATVLAARAQQPTTPSSAATPGSASEAAVTSPPAGAQRKDRPILGDATMTEDRTIIVHMWRTGDGMRVSAMFKYPVGHPDYLKILNHLGGMNPGDTRLVPAWDDDTRRKAK